MSTLNDFISFIKKNNIAKSNRFKVTFNLPSALTTAQPDSLNPGESYMKIIGDAKSALSTAQTTETGNSISLTCLMIDIPSRQESVSEFAYGNYSRKIANGRSYGDVSTTFLVTGKYAEKSLFDAWFNTIHQEANTSLEFYDNYISTVVVECLDNQDKTVYTYTLLEAYPTSMGAIRMDRTSQNQQILLDVNWTFHRITYGTDARTAGDPMAGTGIPPTALPTVGSGKNRLFPIPGIDSFSSAVQTAVQTVKEFKGQVEGALAVVQDVKNQVRDAQMQVLDGVKTINGVVKDFKAIANVPTDVKNEVVGSINAVKNQLGSLNVDVKAFNKYPTK
jgi:hypothetical protein